MSDFHVLIAEDQSDVRRVILRVVRALGWSATAVANGLAALKALRDGRFDLLVTDLDMPSFNGLSLIRALHQERKSLPVVVVSGFGGLNEVADVCDSDGVLEYVRKPFNLNELRHALARASGRQLLLKQNHQEPKAVASTPPVRNASAAPAGPLTLLDAIRELTLTINTGSYELPVIPQTLHRLTELQKDPDLSSDAVIKVVEASATFARRTLVMANSVAYRGSRPAQNLTDAVIRLGNRTVLLEGITMLQGPLYMVRHPVLRALLQRRWSHTLLWACMGRELTRVRKQDDPCDVYLALLFADIGEVAALRFLDERLHGTQVDIDEKTVSAFIDEVHEMLGGALLSRWRMPVLCRELASNHHSSEGVRNLIGDKARRCAHVLNIAREFARSQTGAGDSPRRLASLEDSCAAIDLPKEHLEPSLAAALAVLDASSGSAGTRVAIGASWT